MIRPEKGSAIVLQSMTSKSTKVQSRRRGVLIPVMPVDTACAPTVAFLLSASVFSSVQQRICTKPGLLWWAEP